jgi:hypothetical protein
MKILKGKKLILKGRTHKNKNKKIEGISVLCPNCMKYGQLISPYSNPNGRV